MCPQWPTVTSSFLFGYCVYSRRALLFFLCDYSDRILPIHPFSVFLSMRCVGLKLVLSMNSPEGYPEKPWAESPVRCGAHSKHLKAARTHRTSIHRDDSTADANAPRNPPWTFVSRRFQQFSCSSRLHPALQPDSVCKMRARMCGAALWSLIASPNVYQWR